MTPDMKLSPDFLTRASLRCLMSPTAARASRSANGHKLRGWRSWLFVIETKGPMTEVSYIWRAGRPIRRKNSVQIGSASDVPISMPRISRRPSALTPTAMMTATETMCHRDAPSGRWRRFTDTASRLRSGVRGRSSPCRRSPRTGG